MNTPTPPEPSRPTGPPMLQLIAAFAAVYLIWGSTYLAIKWAVESLPPFLMAGARFVAAGAVMLAWARLRGEKLPSAANWRAAMVSGAFLLLGGNGGLVWASRPEQGVPSGVASLLIATTPFWMVLLDWLRPGGARPSLQVILGLAIGLCGLFLLVSPARIAGEGSVNPIGAVVLILGTLCWSWGSIYARGAKLPSSAFLAAGMQQLSGGGLLIILALILGDASRFDPAAVSARAWLSFAYLLVVGSLVAFTAYVWLLKATSPARVATYAYVNPVVAVFLGWALNGESPGTRTIAASVIIVSAVAVITSARTKPS